MLQDLRCPHTQNCRVGFYFLSRGCVSEEQTALRETIPNPGEQDDSTKQGKLSGSCLWSSNLSHSTLHPQNWVGLSQSTQEGG